MRKVQVAEAERAQAETPGAISGNDLIQAKERVKAQEAAGGEASAEVRE